MNSASDEVELLPIATRKGFAEVARDLVQRTIIDESNSPGDDFSPNSPAHGFQSSILSKNSKKAPSSSTKQSKQSLDSKISSQSRKKQDPLEPKKFDPSSGLREYKAVTNSTTFSQAALKKVDDPEASILQTEFSTSTRSQPSTAPSSLVDECLASGAVARNTISQGQRVLPGFRAPPEVEKYSMMEQPTKKSLDEALTTGYVRQNTPKIAKTSEEHDSRMNSVYAQ